jgi:threonine dehydratase
LTRSETTSLIAETAARCRQAAARIKPYVRNTELATSAAINAITGADIYFKMENRQHSGSFKIRGAFNRLLTLTTQQRRAGCVSASSGNHGAAVACALQSLAIDGVIFVPKHTSSAKVEAIRAYGGDVRFFGDDGLDTETHAREFADREGLFYVSPYNDHEVIAGQGTCGTEIEKALPDADAAFIAVGGGGLVSGIGSVLKAHNPDIMIYGCQPQASAVMAQSVAAGRIVDMRSDATLSDGTAGGIEQNAVTFPITREVVDEFVIVSEAEIAAGMRMFMDSMDESIEGAAGVAVAAMLQQRSALADRKIAVIICGGNISDEDLARVSSGAV